MYRPFESGKEYTTETPEETFFSETTERLTELSDKYSEIRELAQVLLLVGGKTIIFDGWGAPEDLETIISVGKFIDAKDVDTAMAKREDCEEGFCWSNAATLLADYKDFEPVYAFALSTYYKTYPFWMEHFILHYIPTGIYHESTDLTTTTIEKYFVMDISKRQFYDMINCPVEW
jgi:hypothetical protein